MSASAALASRTYRCGDCGTRTVTDDDLATCDGCDGILFDDEVVTPPQVRIPAARALRFVPDGRDYALGDDRCYDVLEHGVAIGVVERGWGFEGGKIWDYSSTDGTYKGSGRSRVAAVQNAYKAQP